MLKFLIQPPSLLRALMPLVILTTAAILPSPVAQANCPGFGRPPAEVDSEVSQRWQQLQADDTNFWGTTKMFAAIDDQRITLTTAFDRLTGPQKQQVLSALDLDGSNYAVYTAAGRLVSAQYDGCTRTSLMTERDRFGWHLTRPPIENASLPKLTEQLRNANNPSWRQVNQSINTTDEQQIRLKFWQTVGYEQYSRGWWIAWVPEGGYFEVTVSNAGDWMQLKPLLPRIMGQYRYTVLASDGTPLSELSAVTNRD